MPIYEYKCHQCGNQYEEFHQVENRDLSICCGQKAQRIISKSQGKPVVYNYYSENADAIFTGPRQKARILKEKGLSEL